MPVCKASFIKVLGQAYYSRQMYLYLFGVVVHHGEKSHQTKDDVHLYVWQENEEGAKGRIGKVPLNANGRHLCTRPIRPRTRSRVDHRRPRKDLLSWIPGQRVRHDHSVPSGSRSPDSLFCIDCIDG
ncbi:unnamed protein product [Boreogadus saida]